MKLFNDMLGTDDKDANNTGTLFRVLIILCALSGVGSLGGNFYMNQHIVERKDVVELISDKAVSHEEWRQQSLEIARHSEKVGALAERLTIIENQQRTILQNLNQLIVKVDNVNKR